MSEPEIPAGSEAVRDDDQAAQARAGRPRAVFAGRLRAGADDTIADGGPNAGPSRTSIAPPAHPPPSASNSFGSVLRDLIDKPETTSMVWVHHPVSGARLFKLPVDLPDHWLATADGEVAASAPAELPPLTPETVLRELARIAFTDPLPPGFADVKQTATRLPVTLRDKQAALVHLGRHFGLFSGRKSNNRPHGSRPYAELSDADLKAKSDDVIRALAGMGVEVRIAEDDAGAPDGAPRPP